MLESLLGLSGSQRRSLLSLQLEIGLMACHEHPDRGTQSEPDHHGAQGENGERIHDRSELAHENLGHGRPGNRLEHAAIIDEAHGRNLDLVATGLAEARYRRHELLDLRNLGIHVRRRRILPEQGGDA